LILLGIAAVGLAMYLNEDFRNGVLKLFGQEPKPPRTQPGPREIGGYPRGVAPIAPTPIAPLPPVTPPGAGVDEGKQEAEKCVAEADLLLASGDFKGAVAVLDKFPPQWRDQYFGQPVMKKRQEVLLAAEAKFNRDIAEANQLRMDAKLAESRTVMDRIKAYLLPSMTDQLGDYQEALRKLEDREKEAGPELEAQKAKDVEKLRAEAHSTMLQYLQQEKYDDGLTRLQASMSDPKYSGVRASLEQEVKDLLRARDFAAAITEGGKNLVGKPLSMRGISGGVLKSFDGEMLVVSLSGKDLPPYRLHDLRPKELQALAEGSPSFKLKDAGEQHMMCAMYLLARKQSKEAGAEFDAAKKAGMADASRYEAEAPPPKTPAAPAGTKKKKTK
jgi:tetratricopeptide (TPR) repeat protein